MVHRNISLLITGLLRALLLKSEDQSADLPEQSKFMKDAN